MMIKAALVAALVLGSASMALAATYHNAHYGYQTRNVALPYDYGSAREGWMDRASRSWGGGY